MLVIGRADGAALLRTIPAGGETAQPADAPSARLDTAGELFFVGALELSNGSTTWRDVAVALVPLLRRDRGR